MSDPDLPIHVLPDAGSACARAAALCAELAIEAIDARRRFTLALSGGRTPLLMFEQLAQHALPWRSVHVFQVDERIAPAHDPARNWTGVREQLLARTPIRREQSHPMPVESPDLDGAARDYARALEAAAGEPPVLDVVQLGLGSDGHTASLFRGDPAHEIRDADVAVTGPHVGWRRMTLTVPALNRARFRIWLVVGAEKRQALAWLRSGTHSIPANRILRDHSVILCDQSAAG